MKKFNIDKYIYPLLIVTVIIFVNLIFSNINLRIDLTKNKIYSLSEGTKTVLKKIKDPLYIDLYYSKELPAQINANKEYAIEILKDYVTYSGGKIRFSQVKLDFDKESREKAIKAGITPVRFDIISREKFEQREGFLGLTVKYQDKKEIIPYIQDVSNFEYDITSRINTIIKDKKDKIYFVDAAGSMSFYTLPNEIKNKIQNNYEIQTITLKELYELNDANIPAFFIGPSEKLTDEELFYFDQSLLKGIRLFLALDRRYTKLDSFFSRSNDTGITKLLEKNGIKIKDTLILDRNSQTIQIGVRQGPFLITNIVKYPFFIITTDLNRENPTTRDIYSLTVPFASPIEYTTDTLKITPLIKTSKYSWAKKEGSYISINPFSEITYTKDDLEGPFTVALIASGKFKPYFNEIPESLRDKNKDKKEKTELNIIKEARDKSMLYLISSSKFVLQDELNAENLQYFINIVNYLSQDEALLTIRMKKAGFIPLKDIKDIYKTITKYANMFIPILIVILYGIYRWKKLEIKYENTANEYGKQ